jgi:hypothetical protein
MARYVLMLPPDSEPTLEPMIIKDSFSVFGLILPVIWLLWNRLWIAAFLAFALLALGVAAAWYWTMPALALALDILVSAYVALEGPALRITLLSWAGWREAGAANALNSEEAELRLLAGQDVALPSAQIRSQANIGSNITTKTGIADGAFPFAFPSRQ